MEIVGVIFGMLIGVVLVLGVFMVYIWGEFGDE
jgi:hypothetical protein